MIRSLLASGYRFTACALLLFAAGANAQAQVDASTLNNKIMAGYQGWFMTPDGAGGASWRHWSPPGVVPDASSVSVDMWPDLREFAASELTATGFKYADGSTAGLFSSFNAASVERHVKWMRDYGIDGVFVQRFVVDAVQMRPVRDKVLQDVRAGAEKHGRVFANMYDISGASASSLVADIKNDWIHLVDNLQVTASSRYLRHEGRPVVSVLGFGVGGRPGSAAELQALIAWFKTDAPEKYRATVKLGVDPDWRTHGAAWQAAYRSVAVLSPWTVGRYNNDAGADAWRNDKITPDLNALSGSGTEYMPVVFPGFSATNLKRGATPINEIPRRGGRFFWRQTYNAIQAGANMVYVAMFDEVDEGTAMYKIAESSSQMPTSGKFLPLNADGETVPSDWYLSLMGEASRMLRGERALSATMPPIGGVAPVPVESAEGSLITGQRLNADQSLASANGVYRLTLHTDGNLVIYNASSQPLWAGATAGQGGVRLELQGDGNLVLYTSAGAAVWSSGTNGSGAARLVMQDDGNLVLETAAGVSVWSTSTGQSGGGGGGGTSAAVVHATKGGVNLTKSNISVSSPARSGDYEIVAVAGSSVQGGSNAPIDSALMTDQGFQLVGVRGAADRKSEIWIRKNNGSSEQASIRITGKGPDVLWSITTIDGSKSELNLSSIQTANTFASHSSSSASFSAPGGSGLLFVAMMFDDPVEVLSAGSGSILFKTWGSGDGNGIASLLFQPGVSVPSSVNIKNYDSVGRQYAVVAARIAVTPLGGGTADTTPPVITLNGSASMTVTIGSSFPDPGATATDNIDGNVSVNVTGSVNVSVVGIYTLQYNARDLAGNNATTVTRIVNVINASDGGSGPGTSSLKTDQSLSASQSIVSANGAHKFVLQGAGNLVLYSSGQVRWAAATQGKGGTQLFLQGDGNLVLRTAAGAAVWSSGTNGKGAVRLVMQDDGNLVLQTAAGATIWSTNTGGSTPPPPVDGRARVAFVGDSGSGGNFQNVLNLIKSEGAEMTMFLGDTSYSSSGDDAWDNRIGATLASTDPVLLAIGNHDVDDSNLGKVVSLSQARLNRQSAVNCNGTYGQRMTCTYKNLYFVVSGIGTIGSDSDQENFIASSLNTAPANTWRICAWHKNQHLMQIGEKSDETGWTVYETCRQKGAFIATGHEHSYSRTHLLSSMTNRTVDSTSSTFTVSPGKSFAFVSGLGGQSIRPQLLSGNWWAKVYTSTQGAKYGVLFGDFYADRADFYFKNIDGQVIDQFTVQKGY